MTLVALFGSVRLFQIVQARSAGGAAFKLLGMDVPQAAIWGGALFIVLGTVIFLFTFGVDTGLKALDRKSHGLIDLLIDTESELAKVSWPTSDVLTRSTAAVLVVIILVGAFIFGIDQVVALVMVALRVLPK